MAPLIQAGAGGGRAGGGGMLINVEGGRSCLGRKVGRAGGGWRVEEEEGSFVWAS